MYSRMAKAFNNVKSTLKVGYEMGGARGLAGLGIVGAQAGYGAAKGFMKQGMAGYSRIGSAFAGASAAGTRKGMSGMNKGNFVGNAMMKSFGRMGTGQKAGMGAIGMAGAGGSYAAADFMNPWGLGWAD